MFEFDRPRTTGVFDDLFADSLLNPAMEERRRQMQPFTAGQVRQAVAPMQSPLGVPQGMAMQPTLPPGAPSSPAVAPGASPQPTSAPGAPTRSNLDRFLSSPGAAMGSQAINNMMALRRGGMPPQTPMQAYQDAVARESTLRLREKADARAEAQNQRQQETHDTALDPAWEYNALRDAGLLPDDMDFVTYEKQFGKKSASDPAAWREWVNFSTLSPDQQKQYLQLKRQNQLVDTGGDSVGILNPDGSVLRVTDPGEIAALNEWMKMRESRGEGVGSGIAKVDNDFRNIADSGGFLEMEDSIENTRRLLADIAAGKYDDTGPLIGTLNTFFGSEQNARLARQTMIATLENLKQTNLAPVSNEEIKMIKEMFANVDRTPEQNAAVLQDVLDMMERKMAIVNRKRDYWEKHETLSGFGIRRDRPDTKTGPDRPGGG